MSCTELNNIFFCENGESIICLLCDSKMVRKLFNAERNFKKNYADSLCNLSDEKRIEMFVELKNRKMPKMVDFRLNDDKLKASFIVAKNIANACKNYSDGEFWKRCTEDVFEGCFGSYGKQMAEYTRKIPLSSRISEISGFVTQKLLQKIEQSAYFSIAVDESTDNKNIAQLMIFIRTIIISIQVKFCFIAALYMAQQKASTFLMKYKMCLTKET